jgi:hypothetical protein
MIASFSRVLLLVGLLAAQGLLSTAASAQANAEGFAVVKADATVLRAGDMPRFYRIMDLDAGTVVKTLGTNDGWTRVAYPAGSNAYVEADRAEKISSNTLRLTKPSSLLAPSALLGASGSWCPLFPEPLPAGTELTLVEEITGIGGKVSKYLVEAPQSPSPAAGFVRADSLRPATPDEINRFGTTTPASTPQANPDQPDTGSTETQTQPDTSPEPDDDLDTSLLEPLVTGPLDAPAQPVENQTTSTEPTQPTTLATNGTGAAPANPEAYQDMVVLSINQLNAAFDELRQLPRDEADAALEEMLAECRRTADKLANEPDIVRAINQRMKWLELRMKLRDQRQALNRTLAESEQKQAEMAAQIQQWRQGRSFTVIGRIFKSTLYDGDRLPLMYRLESVDGPGFGRTTAYLRPTEDRDFSNLVGAIVGVLGKPLYDDALGVRIITVESIQTLDRP